MSYIVIIGNNSKLDFDESNESRADRFANTCLSCSKTCEPQARILCALRCFLNDRSKRRSAARSSCASAWFSPNHSVKDAQVENVVQSSWYVRPMQGGLGGNKEFEEEAIEVRSQGSKWVEVLVRVEGKLGRNNSLKLADEK